MSDRVERPSERRSVIFWRLTGSAITVSALAAQLAFSRYAVSSETAPALHMASTWIWIWSPYAALLVCCLLSGRFPRGVVVWSVTAALLVVVSMGILWIDMQTGSKPGGMSPFGGRSNVLALVFATFVQWIICVAAVFVGILVIVAGPRPQIQK